MTLMMKRTYPKAMEQRSVEMLITLKTGRLLAARAESKMNMPIMITKIKKNDARKALIRNCFLLIGIVHLFLVI